MIKVVSILVEKHCLKNPKVTLNALHAIEIPVEIIRVIVEEESLSKDVNFLVYVL